MDRIEAEKTAVENVRRLLGPFARAILTTTPQGSYLVQVEDLYVGLALRHHGNYAPVELQILQSLCTNQTRLLVIGAHIGALAVPLAKICRSVVAIEANPQTFGLLQLNVALNGLSNVRTIHKAASNRVEQIDFVMSRNNTGGSKRMPLIREAMYFHDNPPVVKVDAAPLDELLPDETFDFVIMDIEGSEYFALQGMQRILASAGILHVEFLPHHLKNVAGVSVADFLAQISPHFHTMCIPSKRAVLGKDQMLPTLAQMYERAEEEPGLIFFKIPPDRVSPELFLGVK